MRQALTNAGLPRWRPASATPSRISPRPPAACCPPARVGLLTGIGAGRYRIHPALPGYLAAWWRREDPDDHDALREAATRALLTAHAALGKWLRKQIGSGDAGFAYSVIALERRTLGSLLGYALDHELWGEAQSIAQPLDKYWEARGLLEEANAWADRARLAIEGPRGVPPELGVPAGALWLFFAGSQVIRQLTQLRLDDAERTYKMILDALQSQPTSPERQRYIGVVCHQLGRVAQDRGQLDQAENWYRKSLTIEEETGDRPGMAMTFGRLAADHGARVVTDVEVALYQRDPEHRTRQFVDPVALGTLIVAIAQLAWSVYSERRAKSEKPTQDSLAREVRITQRTRTEVTGTEEKIIEVVVSEVLRLSETQED